ncbi:HK97 gp10 family phage protein [Enterococcus sp. BWB1-3]|uniref:HK97 gp10 family phage protein n=1 Tax=Enterococcus sp. BWB1-3 TaxID=2787713 RepID=UPI0019241C47|nr:HK97 gp10 family phage protein [Enterococcus sp. BWB1-3]MBL1228134.1 HK97 gp10 family phage protein [Enterococcus sp. BWB1-3]
MGVTVRGKESLLAKLNNLPKAIEQASKDATWELTDDVLSKTQLSIQSSAKHSSGELAGSYQNEVVVTGGNKIVGRVWSDKMQAIFFEFGTGEVGQESQKDLPEGINPVYTQGRWFFPVDSVDRDLNALYGMPVIEIQGTEFYMTRGQPAHPALYPALKEVSEYAEEVYAEHIDKAVRDLAD